MHTLTFFAVFKDHFGESIQINESELTPEALRNHLASMNILDEGLDGLLDTARFAVAHRLVDEGYVFQSGEHIYVIPPSGGG